MSEIYRNLSEAQAIAAFIATANRRGIRVRNFSVERQGRSTILIRTK